MNNENRIIRFSVRDEIPAPVKEALEELAVALAGEEIDEVQGFAQRPSGPTISFGGLGTAGKLSTTETSFCLGFTVSDGGGSSCTIDWR